MGNWHRFWWDDPAILVKNLYSIYPQVPDDSQRNYSHKNATYISLLTPKNEVYMKYIQLSKLWNEFIVFTGMKIQFVSISNIINFIAAISQHSTPIAAGCWLRHIASLSKINSSKNLRNSSNCPIFICILPNLYHIAAPNIGWYSRKKTT